MKRQGRVALEEGSGLDVLGNSRLTGNLRPFSNLEMTTEARLSPHHHVILELDASTDAYLSHDQASLANFYVVPNLDQVVYLGTCPDTSFIETGPVNASVRPNLNVFLNDYLA